MTESGTTIAREEAKFIPAKNDAHPAY